MLCNRYCALGLQCMAHTVPDVCVTLLNAQQVQNTSEVEHQCLQLLDELCAAYSICTLLLQCQRNSCSSKTNFLA